MNFTDVNYFKNWFWQFCKSYKESANRDDQKNYILKEVHTHEVCKHIDHICRGLCIIDDSDILIAEAIGLFHDIGRFPQYAQYKTFRDNISVNHGVVGADILVQNGLLKKLLPVEQSWIIDSVKFHNAFKLPRINDPKGIFFLKLIRDADKLDIFRVVLEQYEASIENRASAVGDGLADNSEVTDEIAGDILKGRIPCYTRLKTLNDYKLMQMSWVYDINFSITLQRFMENGYLTRLLHLLPSDNYMIEQIFQHLNTFICKKLGKDNYADI